MSRPLPSTVQSDRNTVAIYRAARYRFGNARSNERRDVFFEHGHYWFRIDDNNNQDEPTRTFSVVDTVGGFDFEAV